MGVAAADAKGVDTDTLAAAPGLWCRLSGDVQLCLLKRNAWVQGSVFDVGRDDLGVSAQHASWVARNHVMGVREIARR